MARTRLMISSSDHEGHVTVQKQELAGIINNRRVWKRQSQNSVPLLVVIVMLEGHSDYVAKVTESSARHEHTADQVQNMLEGE